MEAADGVRRLGARESRGARRTGAISPPRPGRRLLVVRGVKQAIELARRGANVTVVDGDDQILQRANAKRGADAVRFTHSLASDLPLENCSADRVVMSLLLHHLAPEQKRAALQEARRVLRPGGRLHVADWGRPRGLVPRAGFLILGLLDGREGTREHGAGQLPARIAGAGFAGVTTLDRMRTPWGTLELIRAHPTSVE